MAGPYPRRRSIGRGERSTGREMAKPYGFKRAIGVRLPLRTTELRNDYE